MNPRYELNVGATLALSAALSLGATMLANADRDPSEVGHVIESVIEGDPNSHVEWHAGFNFPPVVGNLSVGSVAQAPDFKAVDSVVTVPILRPWALHFSQDPMATKPVENAELQGVDSVISGAINRGVKVTGLSFEGHASDEDDTAYVKGGTNPGLGIANEKNVTLANTREHTAGPIIETGVEALTGYEVPVAYLPGKEDIDPAFADQVMALAKKLDVPAVDLVMQYNLNPNSVPVEARHLLNELVGHRRVDVQVHLREMVAVPHATPKTDAEIVPLGLPVLSKTQPVEKAVPVAVPGVKKSADYPKPGFVESKVKGAQYIPPVQQRQVQPRNHNFSKTAQRHGGRMSRTHGGNRSGKRF